MAHSTVTLSCVKMLIFFVLVFVIKKPSHGCELFKDGYAIRDNIILKEDSYVYPSLWQYNMDKRTFYRKRYFFKLFLLLSGDIEICPGPFVPELSNLLKNKGLSMVHQNVRWLFGNKPYIECIIDNHKNIDIISLSETHIASTDLYRYEIPGYQFHSRPRNRGSGGGVGAYISSNITSERRLDLENENIELMWLEIQLNNAKNFLVGVIYRPPDSSNFLPKNFNQLLSDNLTKTISESKEVILMGDVNVNYLDKKSNIEFKAILNLHGLKQLITAPTRITKDTRTLIDIIATTNYQNVKCSCTIPSGIADHEMVECIRKANHSKYEPKTITVRDYRNYDPDSACNDLNPKDWKYFYSLKDVNSAWNVFYDYLINTINVHAPKISRRIKGKACPWMTPEIKGLMAERDRSFRKSRKTKKEADISMYKNLRNRVNILVRKAISIYNKNLLTENKNDPSKFWSVIKSIYDVKGKSEIVDRTFTVDGVETSDKRSIANGFGTYFSKIVGLLKNISFPLVNLTWTYRTRPPRRTNATFKFKYVSKVEVESYLKSIKRNKATGLDDLPAGFLKDTAKIISSPLSHLINMSLESGLVPTPWKAAKVNPVFKSGSKNDFGNYRPISILPIVSKIIEKAVHKQLTAFLEENKLLSKNQFGFRSKRSTELATTLLLDDIRKSVDSGHVVGAVFVDFTKAFDTLSHAEFQSKLAAYGVQDNELSWFSDYLFNRKQSVVYGGQNSNSQSVTSGVPQESLLGPLLFLLYLNDVGDNIIHSNIIHYADDTVLYYAGKDLYEIESKLSTDFSALCNWCADNELLINMKKNKTEVMMFGTAQRLSKLPRIIELKYRYGIINVTTSYKYLGIKIDSTLNLNSQFDTSYKKASARLNLLARLRNRMDIDTANAIYRTMVLPMFRYCSLVQLKQTPTQLKKYTTFERRAARILGNTDDSKLPTIQGFRKRTACEFVRKCLDDMICENFHNYFEKVNHSIATRNNNVSLRLPALRTEYGKRSSGFMAAKIYNELPINIRSEMSFTKFSLLLKEHLI